MSSATSGHVYSGLAVLIAKLSLFIACAYDISQSAQDNY